MGFCKTNMEKLWEFLKIINYMEFASLNT